MCMLSARFFVAHVLGCRQEGKGRQSACPAEKGLRSPLAKEIQSRSVTKSPEQIGLSSVRGLRFIHMQPWTNIRNFWANTKDWWGAGKLKGGDIIVHLPRGAKEWILKMTGGESQVNCGKLSCWKVVVLSRDKIVITGTTGSLRKTSRWTGLIFFFGNFVRPIGHENAVNICWDLSKIFNKHFLAKTESDGCQTAVRRCSHWVGDERGWTWAGSCF